MKDIYNTEKRLKQLIQLNVQEKILFYSLYLMWVCGWRVSEVLRVKCSELSLGHLIIVEGSKGGKSRSIIAPGLPYPMSNVSAPGESIGDCYSRFQLYRYMKSCGLMVHPKGSKNNRVCHAGRYLLANEVESKGLNSSTITDSLGHKAESSDRYYLRK